MFASRMLSAGNVTSSLYYSCQLHQRFTCTFFVRKSHLFSSYVLALEFLVPKFCTKNARVKRRWNDCRLPIQFYFAIYYYLGSIQIILSILQNLLYFSLLGWGIGKCHQMSHGGGKTCELSLNITYSKLDTKTMQLR